MIDDEFRAMQARVERAGVMLSALTASGFEEVIRGEIEKARKRLERAETEREMFTIQGEIKGLKLARGTALREHEAAMGELQTRSAQ